MPEDLTVFWQNNARAYALFQDLLQRSERDAYDDEFLVQLAAYREEAPASEHADIFAARYLLHHGDAEGATACGERAFGAAPINHAVWDVLSRGYIALGRYADALVMQGYLSNAFNVPITLNLPPQTLTGDVLDRLSIAMGQPSYGPLLSNRMFYDPATGLSAVPTTLAKEFLPVSPHITPSYYVGVYTEQELHGNKDWLLSVTRNAPGYVYHVGGDFVFDIIRGQAFLGKAYVELSPEDRIILPVLGAVRDQQLHIQSGNVKSMTWLSPATPNFFRLEESAELSSEQAFIIGSPIHLGHSAARRPLVLNILADALAWTVVRDRFAQGMPNTHRFFQKGLIFDQNFSVAEYTYPSFATIETGMYQHHSQIFNDKIAIELREDYTTLSECMRACGYTTINLMGAGDGLYNGTSRGYDRLVITPYDLPAATAVERVIRYLEGARDADHFILMHTLDAHLWPNKVYQISSSTQMRVPLADRLIGDEELRTSPYMRPHPLYQDAFWQGVHDLDRALGTLFSYLEAHYEPEEYLITLYSDHGTAIFSTEHYIVDAQITGAAWMMCGSGVPAGVVSPDMTSIVDLYPTLGHLMGFPVGSHVDGVLPKIFGGPGREIAYSQSLYPGKEYYLAARSASHTLCVSTEEPLSMDGKVDLAKAKVRIYPRDHENEEGYAVDNAELRAFFYPRVRAFLGGIASNNELFPPPRPPKEHVSYAKEMPPQ